MTDPLSGGGDRRQKYPCRTGSGARASAEILTSTSEWPVTGREKSSAVATSWSHTAAPFVLLYS